MSDDSRIDALYQLPLDQFTPARNALAKELKQSSVKALEKPNLAAWAVNQLYWQDRALYDRLMRASERLRGEHRKLLSGKVADVHSAEKAYREATRDAVGRIRGLLEAAGETLSPATLTAVQETLEALPTSERPGRLTRPLKPLGFEALSGATIKPALRIVSKPAVDSGAGKQAARGGDDAESDGPSRKRDLAKERQLARQREKEEQERKERQRQAAKELKAAEAAMLRAEDAVKKAEKTLKELREARDAAVSEYQRARLRAHE
jgi:hypothetical protein